MYFEYIYIIFFFKKQSFLFVQQLHSIINIIHFCPINVFFFLFALKENESEEKRKEREKKVKLQMYQ